MAYPLTFGINLPESKAGLTLNAQIVDTSGSNVGAAITTGFVEFGTGHYMLHIADIPDDHRGGIYVYESGVPATILASGAINPEEAEYVTDAICQYPPGPPSILEITEETISIDLIEQSLTADITDESGVTADITDDSLDITVNEDDLTTDISD